MHQLTPTAALACALTLLPACSGGSRQTFPPRHLSASQHDAEADRNEREAAEHEAVYQASRRQEAGWPPVHCFDQVVSMPAPAPAGQPLTVLRPCWTAELSPSKHQLREAAEHRRQAAEHRAMAATLRRAERDACRGLGEDEMSHSPFYHRDDILGVEAVRRDGELRGARVVFRRVPGLTATWMRTALACHEARAAALGYATSVSTYDPLMVAPTSTAVEDLPNRIVVTVVAQREEEAAAILGRAEDLLIRRPTPPARGTGR